MKENYCDSKTKLSFYRLSFSETIKEFNFCISNNPKGLDLNWPKSYAELFYDDLLKNLYIRKNTPNILEINQFNNLKDFLWLKYFKNPKISNKLFFKDADFINIKKLSNEEKNDLIIINDYKNISSLPNLLDELVNFLNKDGVIIIENFHFCFLSILRLYFLHSCKIYDFRLNRFIINNCILVVYKNKKRNFQKINIGKIKNLINFLLIDNLYRLSNLILEKFRTNR